MGTGVLSMVTKAEKKARWTEEIRVWADRMADKRAEWLDRNRYYYDEEYRYLRFLIPEGRRVLDLGCGTGELLARLEPSHGVGVDLSAKMLDEARANYPDLTFVEGDIEDAGVIAALEKEGPFDFIVLSDTMGYLHDCEAMLATLQGLCNSDTRIVVAYHCHLWDPVLKFGEMVGLRMPTPAPNWLDMGDISNFLELAGFETVKKEWRLLLPKRLWGIGAVVNRFMAPLPLIRRLNLRHYVVGRSLIKAERRPHSATVVIPCRNERGNIEPAVQRLPRFCDDLEIIFIEGHSQDGTWEEILRVKEAYPDLDIKAMKQSGKGKGDATHTAFDAAGGEILMILDADLTVPPEDIPKFYDAVCSGQGEYVNGTRLIYPMEGEAMRFLNYLANRTFANIFTYLLNQPLSDTLCGTKVLRKKHYDWIVANRSYFGDFDPFGDFDLIFGAAKLNLKFVEVPIRYADRTYGSTQISRFTHGWLLLKMVVYAFRKLKAF
ncbi:MAG: glycosyltransferase [Methyloligellaceae bacterium]